MASSTKAIRPTNDTLEKRWIDNTRETIDNVTDLKLLQKRFDQMTFDRRQLEVLRILRTRSTEKYAVADWYFGALSALRDTFNPDRIPQAAHSLRDLLEKIPRAFETEEPGFKGDQLKQKREFM